MAKVQIWFCCFVKSDMECVELGFEQYMEYVPLSDVVDEALRCVCLGWATARRARNVVGLERFAEGNFRTKAKKWLDAIVLRVL